MNEYDVEKFSYDTVPLHPSMDSIRLLTLLPAKEGGAIRCRLATLTFAQRPKYEALSYRWGSTSQHSNRLILVNGTSLLVGKNLFQALKNLRHEGSGERILWVDAVCINQSDLDERNSQVGMMPWIYSRAQTVIVWLGVQRQEGASDSLRPLAEAEYWRRVWIIQEIGLARRILICFKNGTMEWSQFIEGVQGFEDCLPYRLKMQLDGKYGNEHGLQRLVESHKDKLCKDPRDHIYGFVGLANDCPGGFPMGYQKPLYEVWKDAMAFKNSKKESSAHDIMKFGKIVHGLLGGKAMIEQREVLVPDPVPMEIRVPSRVAGRIVHLGPPYEEAISSYRSVANWKASINRCLPEDRRAGAREESELFLEVLESAQEEDLEFVSGVSRDISWTTQERAEITRNVFQKESSLGLAIDEENHLNYELLRPDSDMSSKIPRLFLMGGIRPLYVTDPGAIGLAPPIALVGDYVCQIHGLKKAVIVRPKMASAPKRVKRGAKSFEIIGTAGLAQNSAIARAAKDNAVPKFAEANFDYLKEEDTFELLVDMPFAYSLLE